MPSFGSGADTAGKSTSCSLVHRAGPENVLPSTWAFQALAETTNFALVHADEYEPTILSFVDSNHLRRASIGLPSSSPAPAFIVMKNVATSSDDPFLDAM